MSDSPKKINIRIAAACIGIVMFGILLTVGTFNDRSISETMCSDNNVFINIFAVLGPMPLFFVITPLSGALVQRSLHSGLGRGLTAALGFLAACAALGICFYGARTFTSSDCLDSVIPSVKKNMAVIIPVMLLVFVPLAYLGYRLAAKNEDVRLAKRIIMLLLAVGLAYTSLEIIKNTMHRPRWRTVVKGYEGVGFIPWYEKFPYTKELPELLGIEKTEFTSFPSGHSMMSMSSFITFPAMAWIVPAFKGKELHLAACGFLYSVTVMFSRIIAGAHYLSDISMSGLIMLTVSVVYLILLKMTYTKDQGGQTI